MKEVVFYVYWLHGTTSKLKGETITDAFRRAGLGAGAVRAVDFYHEDKGSGPTHVFNIETKKWEPKVPPIVVPSQQGIST